MVFVGKHRRYSLEINSILRSVGRLDKPNRERKAETAGDKTPGLSDIQTAPSVPHLPTHTLCFLFLLQKFESAKRNLMSLSHPVAL